IRLGSWESARPFKEIFCDDIWEFESYMPSQAVGSPSPSISKRLKSREELFRTRGCGEGAAVDQMVTANVAGNFQQLTPAILAAQQAQQPVGCGTPAAAPTKEKS